jgi:23S rRNA (cytidine1920-2'-O)/16S rRNA (cytidine1409-2'-O)-methyltransferase
VDGIVVSKAGTPVDVTSEVALREEEMPYVSRGGLKLAAALDCFGLDPSGKVAMDIGCSTGGFTDCLLQRNAARVYAIDVGYGQFDWRLRKDPRVILMEKTNIRYLEKERVPEEVDLVVIDVSFISLRKVLPRVLDFLAPDGCVVALVKPQFEVGRGKVGKGGIVKDESLRLSAVSDVRDGAGAAGFEVSGFCDSPITGQKGNREYFLCLRKG